MCNFQTPQMSSFRPALTEAQLRRRYARRARAGAQRRTAQPLTRLACGGIFFAFLGSGLISSSEGEACTWYVGDVFGRRFSPSR